MTTMIERTPRATANTWHWFRRDPELAGVMQSVLVTGEGGDIITAMRAMSPQSLLETVGLAFGELCRDAEVAYAAARTGADQWAFWQLVLGVTTVSVIAVSAIATLAALPAVSATAAAVAFVTGSAAMWFDRQVDINRRQADARYQEIVRYGMQNKLILQIGPALDGLEPEQQEQLIVAVLSLRV